MYNYNAQAEYYELLLKPYEKKIAEPNTVDVTMTFILQPTT